MADHHINFKAHEVRAALDGRKTQHRFVLKLPKKTFSGGPIYERPDMGGWEQTINGGGGGFKIVKGEKVSVPETVGMWHKTTGVCIDAPYQASDRLWVRESWRTESRAYDDLSPSDMDADFPVIYDTDADWSLNKSVGRRRQATHMPRWASRLTLIVESVKVERLNEISEKDARAEGFPITHDGRCYDPPPSSVDSWQGYGRASFHLYWSQLHGPGSWDANPWVAAIGFRVVRANIDTLDANPVRAKCEGAAG